MIVAVLRLLLLLQTKVASAASSSRLRASRDAKRAAAASVVAAGTASVESISAHLWTGNGGVGCSVGSICSVEGAAAAAA